MKKVKINELKEFSVKALEKVGVSKQNAETVAEVLVATDVFGVVTHGTKNLCQYIEKMQAGGLDAQAEPSIVCEGLSYAIIDGNKAVGMVSACKAMELAIKKAKETGVAYVGVRNSCHFGASGYYANMAAKEGLLGISVSNADPIMAIPNSARPAIGTNPFSFAVPLGDGKSLFLDCALSNVAALRPHICRSRWDCTSKRRAPQLPFAYGTYRDSARRAENSSRAKDRRSRPHQPRGIFYLPTSLY